MESIVVNMKDVTVSYTGTVSADIKTHLTLMRLFKRTPTPEEFTLFFDSWPLVIVNAVTINDVNLTGHLNGLKKLTNLQLEQVISKMITHKHTADDIAPYVNRLETNMGNTKLVKRAKKYFGIVPDNIADNELTKAIVHFHETGEIANGLVHQAAYDEYIHTVMNHVRDEEEEGDIQEIIIERLKQDDEETST
jgi:hypothetical protein